MFNILIIFNISEAYSSSNVCPSYKNERENVGGTKETYIFLWYVANTITYRQLGNLFGICDKTAWCIIQRMSTWLVSISDTFIKWPRTPEEINQITLGFEAMKGISGVLGAIDGTHIKIRAPSGKAHLYTNRKKYCSIIMQAVVDDRKKFIDVHCGEPGSFHDCRVLRRSILYRAANQEYGVYFPSDTFLLGDCAYGPRRWLVPPYKDTGNLTQNQHKYNHLLSSTRMVVENAFGLLKTRFRRIMHFTEHLKIEQVINITIACCVLHNLCEDQQDYWDLDINYSEDDDLTGETSDSNIISIRAHDRLATILNSLLEKGLL